MGNKKLFLLFSALLLTCTICFSSCSDGKTQVQRIILRDADGRNFDAIYAPLPEQRGIGLALYNRMIRAAAHHIIRLECDGK